MSADSRPLKVFLCHAHADRDPVRGLYTRLTKDGVDVWLDKAKLLPGQDWELEIRKAVREADVVVVCLSKQFNQAGFRQKEVRLALDTAMEKPEGEIFIIPARLEECDNLESLRKWHWVDLFEDDGYEMLMRALRARANNIGSTLQVKKNWLPKITSSNSKTIGFVEQKKLVASLGIESVEKPTQEKSKKDIEREATELSDRENRIRHEMLRKNERESLLSAIRDRLAIIRIYWLPILFFSVGIALLVFYIVYLQKNLPRLTQSLNFAPQPSQVSTEEFLLDNTPNLSPTENLETFTPIPVMGTPTLFSTDTQVVPSETISSFGGAVLSNDENLEFFDDFNGSTDFHFFSGEPEFKILEDGESVLHLGSISMGRKIFLSLGGLAPDRDTQRGSETVRMAFKADDNRNGFLSLQWGTHYPFREIRIYPGYSEYTLSDVSDEKSVFIGRGTFACSDSHSWNNVIYLELEYKDDENIVIAKIDNCEPITFTQFGGFGSLLYLMPYDLNSVDLYYFLIANPK